MPIEKELSHSKPKRRKKKKVKHDPSKLRRSTRNSRLTRTEISTLAKILKALLMLGLLCFTTSPIQGEQLMEWLKSLLGRNPVLADDDIDFDDSFPESMDNPKTRKLWYYHYVLDILNECEDREDSYSDYNWKVDKIITHKLRRTKKGHVPYLLVMWKPGNKSWISLRSLRHHDPYACVLYASSKKDLVSEPHWQWVTDFINDQPKYEKLVKAMRTSKSFGPKYKFGIEVPRSIRHALLLDKINGNNLWAEAIQKELKQLNDFKVFRSLHADEQLAGFQRLPYHMVFDVKFDLRWKARLVVGGSSNRTKR